MPARAQKQTRSTKYKENVLFPVTPDDAIAPSADDDTPARGSGRGEAQSRRRSPGRFAWWFPCRDCPGRWGCTSTSPPLCRSRARAPGLAGPRTRLLPAFTKGEEGSYKPNSLATSPINPSTHALAHPLNAALHPPDHLSIKLRAIHPSTHKPSSPPDILYIHSPPTTPQLANPPHMWTLATLPKEKVPFPCIATTRAAKQLKKNNTLRCFKTMFD